MNCKTQLIKMSMAPRAIMLATSNFCHTCGRKEFIWIHRVVLKEKKIHILLGYLSAADKDYPDFCESWWEPLIICLTHISIETPNTISSILKRWKFCWWEHVLLDNACCFWVDSILGLSSQHQVGLRMDELKICAAACWECKFRSVFLWPW